MGRAVGAITALVILAVVAVVLLRDSTMTVHAAMPLHSRLVLDGHASSRNTADRTETLTKALTEQCVAETADRSSVTAFTWRDSNHFHVEITPALDKPDRRQLQGCLEDLRMPRLLVSVVDMQTVGGDAQV